VVTINGSATNAVLDGFTITGGNTAGAGTGAENGAGMLISDSSPTLANLIIQNNTGYYGGGFSYIRSTLPRWVIAGPA
jgi:hypothetical protein